MDPGLAKNPHGNHRTLWPIHLPTAGGYYVVGPVDDLENGGQYDPQVLTSLSTSGSKVTVTEGGSVQRDFRVR